MADQNEKVIARDRDHLKQLIDEAIEKNGPNCDLNFIDVSNVTDMSGMFCNSYFNGDVSRWDVSNVINMKCLFKDSQFNGDVSKWDISNVIHSERMFCGTPFERDGKVKQWFNDCYHKIIESSKGFSGKLIPRNNNHFRVLVKAMIAIYGNECNLNIIDTSNVTDMSELFKFRDFNGDISQWDVSNVTTMEGMFFENHKFNGDISKWDVSNVTDMSKMFFACPEFNGDLSKWDVSNVTDMHGMFAKTDQFNGDLSNWNTSNVINTDHIFACSSYESTPQAKQWFDAYYHQIIESSKNSEG